MGNQTHSIAGNDAARLLTRAFCFTLLVTCGFGRVHAATPAIIWHSQPVRPGEAVMVYGGPFDEVAEVTLAGPDKRTVKPLKTVEECLTFVYPADWPLAAFSAEIANGTSPPTTIRVNAADVWWLQGDTEAGASPGGWLRAFGRSIGYNKQCRLELQNGDRVLQLPATQFDLYSLRVELPAKLPAGEYAVHLNNGLDAQTVFAGNVTIAPQQESWPADVFNVCDYGAIANDTNDDSRAVHAALQAIRENNGGVLYFPRGRFGMRGTLELPPHTLLRGAGLELTQIYWLDNDHPAGPLLTGMHHFGVEEIFLVAANIDQGIVATAPQPADDWRNEHILFRRVRARFLHTDAGAEEGFRRSQTGGKALQIEGDFVRIVDCDFYFSKGDSVIRGRRMLVSGNRFVGPQCGYVGGEYAIFENNNSEGRGMSFANGSRCFYFHGNRLGAVYGDGDRETFTFDGGDHGYADTVVSTSDRQIQLKPGAWRHGADVWIGRPVYILGGKGAGQLRFISRIDGRNIEIDRPWDIQPDADSYFVIALIRSKLLFLDNHDRDGSMFALYGGAADVVIAGNSFERCGGLHAHGMQKANTPEPSWFVQFLENRIVEGNSVRGPFSYIVPAADSWLGYFDRGIRKPLTYPLNRVGVVRRNVLENNAFLDSHGRVRYLLMENNTVRNADKGVVIAADVQHAILRGNRFENVVRPYNVNDDVMIPAVDRLLAGLSAVKTLHGDLPDNWEQIVAQAEALADRQLPEPDAAAAVADVLKQAVQAIAVQFADRPIPPATLAALLGFDLSQDTPWLFSRLARTGNTKARVPLHFQYPSWSLPAKLTARTDGFNGWEIRIDCPAELTPGEQAVCDLWITRPDRPVTMFTLPVEYHLSGDGWQFTLREEYTWGQLNVTDLLIAGPFKNASGKALDTEVHPPEIRLDVTASYDTLDGSRPWVPVHANDNGKVDLCDVFANTEMATAHAVAVVRSVRPLQVKVAGGGKNSLVFVNGKRIGSSARRDTARCVDLHAGDNLLHLISSHGSGAWPIAFNLTAVDPLQPGELQVVPAEKLAGLLASAAGERIPQGNTIANSLGLNWTLLYSDDFNRQRLGTGWTCRSPSYMSQNLRIVDGTLTPDSGWGYLTFDHSVAPPVRIEFDMLPQGNMGGALLCPQGLSWRNLWGNLSGRGYLLSLGWHDAKNNRVLRDTENAIVDDAGKPPQPDKWHHVTAQFVPPRCQLYVDGQLTLDYTDSDFLSALDRVGLFTIGGHRFDNVRIYTTEPPTQP